MYGKRRRQIARTIQEWNGHSTDFGLACFEFRFLTRSRAGLFLAASGEQWNKRDQPIDLWCPPSSCLPSHLGKPFSVLAPARQHTFVHTCAKLRSGHWLLDRSLPAYARRYGPIERAIRGHRRSGAGLLAIANERTAATQARRRHRPPDLPAQRDGVHPARRVAPDFPAG